MMAAVICLTAVFIFANIAVFAQSLTNSQGTKKEVKQSEVRNQVGVTDPSTVPYNNYKGISDLEMAKKAWLKDHSEENYALSNKENQEVYINYKGIKDPAEAKAAWVKDNQPRSEEQIRMESMPYYNYKGITDVKAAKEAWVSENPEAYKKLNVNSTPQNAEQKKAAEQKRQSKAE